jgi:hypothetical protein
LRIELRRPSDGAWKVEDGRVEFAIIADLR